MRDVIQNAESIISLLGIHIHTYMFERSRTECTYIILVHRRDSTAALPDEIHCYFKVMARAVSQAKLADLKCGEVLKVLYSPIQASLRQGLASLDAFFVYLLPLTSQDQFSPENLLSVSWISSPSLRSLSSPTAITTTTLLLTLAHHKLDSRRFHLLRLAALKCWSSTVASVEPAVCATLQAIPPWPGGVLTIDSNPNPCGRSHFRSGAHP